MDPYRITLQEDLEEGQDSVSEDTAEDADAEDDDSDEDEEADI